MYWDYKMYRASIIIGLCLLIAGGAGAQKKKTQTSAQGIKLIARAYADSVSLRWAPTNTLLWKTGNENGYILKRYTILRKGKVLEVPEEVTLTPKPLKPLPLKDWEEIVKVQERYGSIAAQALYGKSFEVSAPTQKSGSPVTEIYHKSLELESRESFALFCADQSYLVATASGLAFTDHNIKADEKYLYRVYAAANPYKLKMDTGFVFTGPSDAKPVPAPYDLEAQSMPKSVLLSWSKTLFEQLFTSYIVERSDDEGKTFYSVTESPIVNTSTAADGQSERFFRVDSISQPERLFVYRLRGVTPFGEVSPPSDTVHAIVHEKLDARPMITSTAILDNGQVKLDWLIPAGKAPVTRFEIERAAAANKPYTKVNTQVLAANTLTFTDPSPKSANYYRVRAITKDGQSTISLPHFVQLDDSIPPAPPAGVTGSIDHNGVVRLAWEAGKEEDIYAYRVFRSNDSTTEFVQVSRAPVLVSLFQDTITLHTLTKNVYYKVVALDKHYNPSDFSALLVLKRPDVIPPVPPFFTNMTSEADAVHMQWQRSTSIDVVKHTLLRSKDTSWQVLLDVPVTDTTNDFIDTSAVPGVTYQYMLVAEDDSHLRSASKPVSAGRLNLGLPAGGRAILKANIDRDKKQIVLKWRPVPDLKMVWVYRASPTQPYRLCKTLTPEDKEFTDTELSINTLYRYKLKIIRNNGAGYFSEEVQVPY
jgi:uncharacterized protein